MICSILVAMLSGARNQTNTHLAQQLFDGMKKRFPQLTNSLTSASILLSNVYAASGEVDKASNIRLQLHRSGVKKQIGLSKTVINGQIFVS